MSGADSPQRGIEPPTSGYGPPPPPDFGVVAKPRKRTARAVTENATGPSAGEPVIAAQPASRPWAVFGIFAAIVSVVALVLGLVVLGIGSIQGLVIDPGGGAPSSETDDSGASDPNQGFGAPDNAAVETLLQAKIDEYKRARDDGSLWSRIPDTTYNRTAVSAFLYFLTDLKLAASFGADTSDYLERASELEQKLLAQEPLGSDISITLEDRTFTYDGDTGEGGYTTNP